MKVLYQQPHLVPPMKLTVYDELPSTPGLRSPSTISRVVSQGKTFAYRASERASFSVRRRPPRRRIGTPHLIREEGEMYSYSFRPLELSIYVEDNRLSDLPEFDIASFSDDGTLKLPPKAKLRAAKSEEALTLLPRVPSTRRVASMCTDRPAGASRGRNTSSIVSTSRPPSEYDALHSHPVSMISVPGNPTQVFHHPANSVSVLSPIKDEFTPPPSALLETMVTDFTKIGNQVQSRIPRQSEPASAPISQSQAPAAPLHFSFKTSRANSITTQRSRRPGTSSSQNARTAHWVHRGHSSSVSSNSTISTLASASTSFSEHRRKRSQFYQCKPWTPGQEQPESQPQPQPSDNIAIPDATLLPQSSEARNASPSRAFSPPKPLALPNTSSPKHSRTRTMSSSTVLSTATVDTDILDDGRSDTSVSTAPVIQDVRINMAGSRKSNVRSFSKPLSNPTTDVVEILDRLILPPRAGQDVAVTDCGAGPDHHQAVAPSTTSVEDLSRNMPPPPPYVASDKESERFIVIKEIGGPLRSPGVGGAV